MQLAEGLDVVVTIDLFLCHKQLTESKKDGSENSNLNNFKGTFQKLCQWLLKENHSQWKITPQTYDF